MGMQSDTSSGALAFGADVTQAAERAVALEWLLANGLGDFACGSVAGPNTRREHGLFTARGEAGRPPMLLLSALDVALEKGDATFPLSCHRFYGAHHPEGYKHCVAFESDGALHWRYEFPEARVDVRMALPKGRRCAAFEWTLRGAPGPWRLAVRPLFSYRDADALTQCNETVDMTLHAREGGVSLRPYPGCPEMFLATTSAEVAHEPCWYYRFEHPWDIALGRAGEEDCFSPGRLTYAMEPDTPIVLRAGVAAEDVFDAGLKPCAAPVAPLRGIRDDAVAQALARSADAFPVKTAPDADEIFGRYPSPRSAIRDTLLALPGLLLCTRRLDAAKRILEGIREQLAGCHDMNALADLPLWFIRAGEQYVDHSRDWDYLRDTLTPAATALAERFIGNTTDGGFRMHADGLLGSSDRGCALTWMDAAIEGWPVTPRTGKPVEVNALWHHALSLLVRWSRRRGEEERQDKYARLRELAGRTIRQRFWNEAAQGLYDVIDGDGGAQPDGSIRPNQVFAVALPSDLLQRRQAEGVLRLVEAQLLTPAGLRTLSPQHDSFQPRYTGSDMDRAAAMHEGSVFPWLLGAYADAVFRVRGRTNGAYAAVEAAVRTLLEDHLRVGCVGQVSQLFHGAAPHQPQGAFAHASALGELIRVYVEIKGRLW